MLRNALLISTVMAGLSAGTAEARIGAEPDADMPATEERETLRLAQARDVDIFYDRDGNQVLLDRETGEVVGVQPRRQGWSERRERRMRELDREAPDFADPGDVIRWLENGGRSARRYDDPNYDPEYSRDPYPEALPQPRRVLPAEREQPRIVERRPLEVEPDGSSDVQSDGGTQGGTIIESSKPPTSIVPPASSTARTEVAELQVLLDRVGASPGVIDGRFGSNVDKALAVFQKITGVTLKSTDTQGIRDALQKTGGDAFMDYTITAQDAAGPYVASVPDDYSEKAKLDRLSYTSVTEMLAERFHMDEGYLKQLNPEANFGRPGTIIKVVRVGGAVQIPVARIVADKNMKQVRAYAENGKLVAAYPATIGSGDTPSPTGTHTVARIAFDPEYTYNPNLNFKQGSNDKVLRIPPGPNGPVGSIWIALSKPTYGIHGTPEPSKIGKTESHGCVRLTNWDAQELAKIVKAGVEVEFLD